MTIPFFLKTHAQEKYRTLELSALRERRCSNLLLLLSWRNILWSSQFKTYCSNAMDKEFNMLSTEYVMDLAAVFWQDLRKCSHLQHTRAMPHLKLTLMKPLHHSYFQKTDFFLTATHEDCNFQSNQVTSWYLVSSNM